MRRVAATLVLAVLGSAAGGCGSSTFACSSDEQCQAGGVAGACQANGYCSFPDEACPTGQRFGDAAPSGVANTCVEPSQDTDTTTGATEDGVPPDPDEGELDGSTLDPAESSSTSVALDDGTSGEPATTTGEGNDDGTTGEVSRCASEPFDDFDDGMIDPMWNPTLVPGATLGEIEGQLRITLPVSFAWVAAGVTMELPPMSGGWARVLITDVPDLDQPVTVGLSFGNGTCDFQLYISEFAIRAFVWYADEGAGDQIASNPDVRLPMWLQLRQDEMGVLHFEHSQDEVTWNVLVSGSFPECGDIEVPLTVLVGSGGQPVMGSVRAVDTFAACVP